MASEYVFIDEWDVHAPQEAVFDALADARTYPEWWLPVYITVDADGPPEVGCVSHQEFKGRLPYHLKTRSEILRLESPSELEVKVVGDLTGRGVWTLSQATDGGVHVHFDWRVLADRALLRVLTPVLRPVFRWNHNWSIQRAIEGLEPYARSRSAS
ncbi:MAG: SRPBCC family protein [Solirubrobacterales bacterium]